MGKIPGCENRVADKALAEFRSVWSVEPDEGNCPNVDVGLVAVKGNDDTILYWETAPGPLRIRLTPSAAVADGFSTAAEFELNDGACQGSGTGAGEGVCWDYFEGYVKGSLLTPQCCGKTVGTGDVDLAIIGGAMFPVGTDFPATPRCMQTTPEDCCNVPGSSSGVSGPAATQLNGAAIWGNGTTSNTSVFGRTRPQQACCGGSGTGAGGHTCGCQSPVFSLAPIRYGTGELYLAATDLASAGFGVPWGHTRSFANRLSVNDTIGQGYNWQVENWPYLVKDYYGNVVVQGEANTSFRFTKNGTDYIGQFGIKESLLYDATAEVFRFYKLDGSYVEFDGFHGAFQKYIDPAGNRVEVKEVHDNGFNFKRVDRTYTSGATTMLEQYYYEYTTNDRNDVLQRVTLRRKEVGPGAFTNVSRATYTYYEAGDDFGRATDLQTVKTETWESNQWQETGTTLYRYHLGYDPSSSSSSSSSPDSSGWTRAHLLKYVVNPKAYERLKEDPAVSDPLTASDFLVAQYADFYYEYDDDRRVTKEMVDGGSQTYIFAYEESGFADGYNSWKTKTSETLPSGATNIVYSNYAGQTMLRVLKSGTDQWCEFWKYNDDGRAVLHAHPSAISGYDEEKADLLNEQSGNYQYLRDSAGLIETFEYHEQSGYLTAEKVQQGELGTAVKVRELEYVSCPMGSSSSSSSSSSGGASDPAAWFTAQETLYPDASDQTKKEITTYTYSFYTGTCAVQEKVTTLPAVATGENGSGTSATRHEYFDQYGNLTWTMDQRGFITRYKYDIVTGAITQIIEDVDTSVETDAPSGWTTPTGGGLNLVTDLDHDDLGRVTQSLGPIHSIDIDGTSTSVRRATWTVYDDINREVRTANGYGTGTNYDTFTLINPVSITKYDLAGNVLEETQAVRGSTSGKLEPTDTFTQTAYVRWTTHQYTDCCLLDSTRVYHKIPNSGSGQSGVNYDETTFQYNASRQMNRQQSPGGTINFTVFDARGNPLKLYIGTDDTGATTGDPTGGGATGNNMVLVTEYEYDNGNDGGDGHITKDTQNV